MRPGLLRRNISQDAAAGSPVYNLARKGGGMQHVSLQESRRKAPMLHVDPRAFCSHLGLSLLGLEDFFYLLILIQQGHLTRSGQDAALLLLRHRSTNSQQVIPPYTGVAMQGAVGKNIGTRVLVREYLKYSLPSLSVAHLKQLQREDFFTGEWKIKS